MGKCKCDRTVITLHGFTADNTPCGVTVEPSELREILENLLASGEIADVLPAGFCIAEKKGGSL